MKLAQKSMKQKVSFQDFRFSKAQLCSFLLQSPECFVFLGQMRLWNPDEPSTPRGSATLPSTSLEERLREACSQLMISWNGLAAHAELLVLSEHLGLQVRPHLELLCLCRPHTAFF